MVPEYFVLVVGVDDPQADRTRAARMNSGRSDRLPNMESPPRADSAPATERPRRRRSRAASPYRTRYRGHPCTWSPMTGRGEFRLTATLPHPGNGGGRPGERG